MLRRGGSCNREGRCSVAPASGFGHVARVRAGARRISELTKRVSSDQGLDGDLLELPAVSGTRPEISVEYRDGAER